MRTIDAHFHIWRQADLPWLVGLMQPRIFGPYEGDPPRLSDGRVQGRGVGGRRREGRLCAGQLAG